MTSTGPHVSGFIRRYINQITRPSFAIVDHNKLGHHPDSAANFACEVESGILPGESYTCSQPTISMRAAVVGSADAGSDHEASASRVEMYEGDLMSSVTMTAPDGLLLAPAKDRLVAFAIDSTLFFVLLLLALPISALFGLGRTAPLFVVSWLGIAVVTNATFQSIVVWLSGGQSVGKALMCLSIRRHDTNHITQSPHDLARLILRHSLGYLVFDVFLVASAWCLLDRTRRCPHDVVMRTQLVRLAGQADKTRSARVRDFHSDVDAGLELVREEWGHWYKLFKWSSRLVISIVTLLAAAMAKLGLLGSASTSSSTTLLPAASATSTPTVALSTAIGTATVSATLVVGGVAAGDLSPPTISEHIVLQASFDDELLAGDVVDDVGAIPATVHGGARMAQPALGSSALELDGSGWIDYGNPFSQRGSVTVEAWVYPRGQQASWAPIVSRWYGDGYYWLGASWDPGGYEWWIEGTHVDLTTGIRPREWQHVAGTYDARTGRVAMYLDGRLVKTGVHKATVEALESHITIGHGSEGGNWRGFLDEVRIWNIALSGKEVCESAGGTATDNGECAGAVRR